MKPLVAVTMGDPCGVGPEIIVKAFGMTGIREKCDLVVLGDEVAMNRAVTVCRSGMTVETVSAPGDARRSAAGVIPLLPLSVLDDGDMEYGRPTCASGDAAFRFICTAAALCLDGSVDAMVTAPINKEALNRSGHLYPGHTELLAELCGSGDYVMMLAGDVIRVSLVTIHEALSDVPGMITAERVLKTIRITAVGTRRLIGREPAIAVLALNPHCGEGGLFGAEEASIAAAIDAARKEGIHATGPHSADTLFYFAQKGEYDAVVAMYHDQGLIPMKMLHFDDGVNVTLGLPIIRSSVDHGTAYGLAGTGRASERSMIAAIRMAADMSVS